jgi:hypothetical protein
MIAPKRGGHPDRSKYLIQAYVLIKRGVHRIPESAGYQSLVLNSGERYPESAIRVT